MKNAFLRKLFIVGILFSLNFLARAQTREAVPPKLRSIVTPDSKSGWYHFIDGISVDPASPEQFFEKYKDLFDLRDGYGMKLIDIAEDKKLQMAHYRFQQTFQGIPLAGVQYILHQRPGKPLKGNGYLVGYFTRDEKPALAAADALKIALEKVAAKLYGWQDPTLEKIIKSQKGEEATLYPQPSLVYYSTSENVEDPASYQLAYELKVFAAEPMSHQQFYISAIDGSVLGIHNLMHETNTPATGAAKYNGQQSFITDFTGANYVLREANRNGVGTSISSLDMNGSTNVANAVDFQNTSTSWQNEPVGVQGHWSIEKAFDYHLLVNGRNSYDGNGGAILSYLDYGTNYNNAFWNGMFVAFGSGDGVNKTSWASIDVVGHELTHGVTQHTAGLIYQNESGALNESFSDIFGAMVEFYAQEGVGDWLVSEDVTTNGQGIRSMANPNAFTDPDTYKGTYWVTGSSDNGGVHTNSGVQNFWFYLLSNGGSGINDLGNSYSVTAIGRDAAAAIAFQNLSHYLMPGSRYRDAREGALEAAEDLFGRTSLEYAQTAAAWYAVGVGFPAYAGQDLAIRSIITSQSCDQLSIELVNLSTSQIIAAGEEMTITVKENGVAKPVEDIILSADLFPGSSTVITLSRTIASVNGKISIEISADYPPDPDVRNNTAIATALRGIVTIGGATPDFPTMSSAVDALADPDIILCGHLDFRLRSGLYNGEIRIANLPAVSSSHLVTFESETGNADDVTLLSPITFNSAYGAISIEEVSGVRIKNMTIVRQAASGLHTAFGVAIRGTVRDLILDGVKIRCTGISGPNRYNISLQPYSLPQSDIVIRNCTLEQANKGIVGGALSSSNLLIENNILLSHQNPIDISGQVILRGNKITTTTLNSDGAGIAAAAGGEVRIEGNQINVSSPSGTNLFGVNVSSATYVKMYNNIINLTGPTTSIAAFIGTVGTAEFYQNTFRQERIGTSAGQVFSIVLNSNTTACAIWNNIFVSTINGSMGIKLFNQGILSNGNDFYFPNGFIGQVGATKYTTLAQWRTATSYDLNSANVLPAFVSSANLHLSSAQAALRSTISTILKSDIDGELRSAPPFMGADEYYVSGDLAITGIRLIDQPTCDKKAVQIDIRNSGTTPYGTGMKIRVSHNVNGTNVVTEEVTLAQSLMAGQTITYTFAQLPFFPSTLKCILTAKIERADANSTNNVSQPLGVVSKTVFTVGGNAPDFATIKQGLDFVFGGVVACNVSLINFKVRSGFYTEPLSIGALPSAAVSILLESESGNRADVVVVNNATSTISLAGARHITFRNLTLQYSGIVATDVVVLLKNVCEDITIDNCNLSLIVPGADRYAVKSGPTLTPQVNFLRIKNSTFINGGIRLESNANVSYPFDNVEITGNTFQNSFTHAIYLARTGLANASDNIITSSNLSSGISITQPLKDVRVERNTITLQAGVYGIYFLNQIPSFSKIYVINNIVHVKSGAASVGGITIDGKGGYMYHNTVKLSAGPVTPATSAIVFNVHNSGVAVRHNIFYSTLSNVVGIDWLSGGSNQERNDIHVPNGVVARIGLQTYPTLSDWQAASGLDLLSTTISPLFISNDDLHLADEQLNLRGGSAQLFPAVFTDIEGDTRSIPAYLGADEYIRRPAAPVGLTATAGAQSVLLNWAPNTEPDLSSYSVYGSPGVAPLQLLGTVNAPATTFTHSPVEVGVQYSYRVSATNTLGNEGPKSAVATVIILPPQVTTFAPASGPVGTSVTIFGNNFNSIASNNIVFFGATRAAVLSATSTQLVVAAPAGGTYQPISVLNASVGLTGYSSRPFVITGGAAAGPAFVSNSFLPKVDFTTGNFPVAVASGDLDGDGKPDMVVMNLNTIGTSPTSISIYRNTASAGSINISSFAGKIDLNCDSKPNSVAIGDFDLDGRPDIAVSYQSSAFVSVYRNLSAPGSLTTASFAGRVNFPLNTTQTPRSVATVDIDGDGKTDLAVGCESVVAVLRNVSTPGSIASNSFESAILFQTSTTKAIAFGDLNGDAKPDLVAANLNSNTVSVLQNTSAAGAITSSSFAAKVDFATSGSPNAVAIGDLDGDAKPDLALSCQFGNVISVLKNINTATTISVSSFAPRVDFATGISPSSITIADLNNDGKPDLEVGNSSNLSVSVLRNVSITGSIDASSFATHVTYAGSQSLGLSACDYDGDGWADIAAANYGGAFTVSVFRNNIGNTPPSVPSGLTATPLFEAVTLDWLPNTESNVASYKVYGGTIPTPNTLLATVAAPTVTYTQVGLTNGTTYYYRISAVDIQGNESAKTSDVSVIPSIPAEGFPTARISSNDNRKVDVEGNTSLRIFPNPAVDRLLIKLESTADARLTMTDVNGKVLLEHHSHQTSEVLINLEDFSSGIYLLRVAQGNTNKWVRVAVNK